MARAVPVLVGRVAALGPIYGRLVPKLLLGNPRKCLVRAGGSGRCCRFGMWGVAYVVLRSGAVPEIMRGGGFLAAFPAIVSPRSTDMRWLAGL